MPVQAQRGDAGTAPVHSQPGTWRSCVISTMLQLLYRWERHYPLYRRVDGLWILSWQHGKSCLHQDSIPGLSSL